MYSDQQEVIQQLIAHNADIAAQAEFPDLDWASVNAGDTAMHIAANKGNIESIQSLLRAYVSALPPLIHGWHAMDCTCAVIDQCGLLC